MTDQSPHFLSSPSRREPYLDVLRVAAILGVVAIHVFGAIVSAPEARGSKSWWAAVVVDIGSIWVVPAFIMVSGALVLTHRAQGAGPASFYRRRLLRLGPAFVFWQVLYIVVARIWISGQNLSLQDVLAMIGDGTTYTHLYFLWLIVGLYAVAPILFAFLAAGGRRRAVIAALIMLGLVAAAYTAAGVLTAAGYPRQITLTAFTQWMPYVGYFVAGAALNGIVLARRRALTAAAIAVLAATAIVLEYGLADPASILRRVLPVGYPTLLTVVLVLALFLAAQSLLAGWTPSAAVGRTLQRLSDASFGVFLVHFVILLLVRAAFPAVAELQRTSFWAALGVWAVVVVASFAVTMLARRVPYLRRIF